MKIKIKNNTNLFGNIDEIPSKSYSHRYLIGNAISYLSGNENSYDDKLFLDKKIDEPYLSEDVFFTCKCLSSLIDIISRREGYNRIPTFICGNSASTLRILTPILMVFFKKVRFICGKQLMNRDILPSLKPLNDFGIKYNTDDDFNIHVPLKNSNCFSHLSITDDDFSDKCIILHGNLNPCKVHLHNLPTSQVLSGLLMALPLLKGDSEIVISKSFQSMPYVNMTLKTLKDFGIIIDTCNYDNSINFKIYGKQNYKKNAKISIENDWSNSSFWIVANFIYNYRKHNCCDTDKEDFFQKLLNAPIKLHNLDVNSLQGDKEILNILWQLKSSSDYKTSIDCSNIPDIFPILALASGILKNKVTEFINIERLSLKESNRIESTISLLNTLGIKTDLIQYKLKVYGMDFTNKFNSMHCNRFTDDSIKVNTYMDHRIAMTAAIASIISPKAILLDNYTCVSKSYPKFWEDFEKLGGKYDKIRIWQKPTH